jgi:hypothetical protein
MGAAVGLDLDRRGSLAALGIGCSIAAVLVVVRRAPAPVPVGSLDP